MEPIFQQLGISLLLGLLVGLQRERIANGIAGMRTFPLITVFGTLTTSWPSAATALIAPLGGWIVAAGLLGVIAVLILGHLIRVQQHDPHLGLTTEMAMLVMYAVGCLSGRRADDGRRGGGRNGGRALAIQARTARHRRKIGR